MDNVGQAEAIDHNLFKTLSSCWKFSQIVDDSSQCLVKFIVNYEFRNFFFAFVAGKFFEEVTEKMTDAFMERCLVVYGGAC